jgi:predicted acetyltransferase
MCNISLIFPNKEMASEVIEFKKDFFENGEKTIHGSYKLDNEKYSYIEWLQIIKNNLDKDKYNPRFGLSHTLFAIKNDGTIVGIVNLRNTITDFYKDSGHIGYSVRPSERNKGYATEILKQVLKIAKDQELEEIYLVCKQSNEPSRKTIIRNCGVLTRKFEKDMNIYEEYKIILKSNLISGE